MSILFSRGIEPYGSGLLGFVSGSVLLGKGIKDLRDPASDFKKASLTILTGSVALLASTIKLCEIRRLFESHVLDKGISSINLPYYTLNQYMLVHSATAVGCGIIGFLVECIRTNFRQ